MNTRQTSPLSPLPLCCLLPVAASHLNTQTFIYISHENPMLSVTGPSQLSGFMICVLSSLEAVQRGEVKRRVGGTAAERIGGQIYVFPLRGAVGRLCKVVGCVHTWRACGTFKHYCESVWCLPPHTVYLLKLATLCSYLLEFLFGCIFNHYCLHFVRKSFPNTVPPAACECKRP